MGLTLSLFVYLPVIIAVDYESNLGCHVVMQDHAALQEGVIQAISENRNPLPFYLEALTTVESQCVNSGPYFSQWGIDMCPESVSNIAEASRKSLKEMKGGRGAEKPMASDTYVLKRATDAEVPTVQALLGKMEALYRENGNKANSLMAPICRLFRISADGEEKYFTVTLKIGVANPLRFPWQAKYDLKGNPFYVRRMAEEKDDTHKDGNFQLQFPRGLFISDAIVRENFQSRLNYDTEILLGLKIMDYSILAHIVEFCDELPKKCARQYRVTLQGNATVGPKDKPFKFGVFTKTCVNLHAEHEARPVFVNNKKEYLYFYEKQWHVSHDYKSFGQHANYDRQSECPESRIDWFDVDGDAPLKLKIIADGKDDTASVEMTLHRENDPKELIWGTAMGKKYVISLGLIDLFMTEDTRGTGNLAAAGAMKGARSDSCSQDDIDPIPAGHYHARFLLMHGYYEPDFPCLYSRPAFIYFPREDFKDCSNDPDDTCKSACEHLGLATNAAKDHPCGPFESSLASCKGYVEKLSGMIGMKWRQSSLWQLMFLMNTDVSERHMHSHIDQLRNALGRIQQKKKDKYQSCLKDLITNMDSYESPRLNGEQKKPERNEL